ncbi:hypothetical protein ACOSP7_012471 [Xanthoceras sorbifolium]
MISGSSVLPQFFWSPTWKGLSLPLCYEIAGLGFLIQSGFSKGHVLYVQILKHDDQAGIFKPALQKARLNLNDARLLSVHEIDEQKWKLSPQ